MHYFDPDCIFIPFVPQTGSKTCAQTLGQEGFSSMGSSKSSSATTASMIGPWVGSFSPAETAGLDVVESVKKE